MTTPSPQQVYGVAVGTLTTRPFLTVISPRAPNPTDVESFQVGQRWVDSTNNGEYFLLNFSTIGGTLTANWVLLNAGSGALSALKDNLGNVVTPDIMGAINVVGEAATGVTTDGTMAANTLTVVLGSIPNSSLEHSSITVNSNGSIAISGSPVSLGNAVSLSVAGGGVAWVDVMVPTMTMAPNTGYIIDNGGAAVTLAIPPVTNLGDTFIVHGKSSGGWFVTCNAGQVVNVGSNATSSGGAIVSTNQWDSVTITCVTANTTFAARAVQGNVTLT